MLAQKTFIKKTRRGNIIKVVREHYLRYPALLAQPIVASLHLSGMTSGAGQWVVSFATKVRES